jgi:hypothetical protein
MNRPLATVTLLLLAAALSGCTGAAPSSSSSSPAASPPAPAPLQTDLVAPTLGPEVRLGAGYGEPNVAVAPDGTIYVTPIDHVYRSTDGAQTFEDLGTQGTVGHGDGSIAVDGTGRLHWLGLFGPNAPIPYQSSDDQGKTFTKAVDLSEGGGSDREWIDATPDGHVYAAWRDSIGYAFQSSSDGGGHWLPKKVKVSGDALGGPIIHDPVRTGTLYIPLALFGGVVAGGVSQASLDLARSEDGGKTWELLPVADSRGSPVDVFATSIFPVVAADQNGTLYLVVSMKQDTLPGAVPKTASQQGVFLFVSKDQGKTWSDALLVSPPLKNAVMPWIAAGAAGRIVITYYQGTASVPSEVLPDVWDVMMEESIDADAATPTFQATKLTDAPNHIGSVCTNGILCIAGGDRSLSDFFSVAIQPNGQPVATWSYSVAGTGVGIAAQGTDIYARAVQSGTRLL